MAGEDVIIARDHKPLLKLVPLQDHSRPLKPGSARGRIWMADDFEAPLDDFKEYM
jgi:antitoxin (DNA-binding transcriptional repressor) of toxin-antitoxin stability system